MLEVRHATFENPAFVDLLREHRIGIVVSDADGRWPVIEDVTSDLVYLRLHGDEELYASGYDDEALDRWAARVRVWAAGGEPVDAQAAGSGVRTAWPVVTCSSTSTTTSRSARRSTRWALAARLGIGPPTPDATAGLRRSSVAAETLDQPAVALGRATGAAVARAGLDVLLGRRRGGAVEVAGDRDRGADRFTTVRCTTTIRSRSPPRTCTSSPGTTIVAGLARSPFTRTWPALQAAPAADLVGKRRTAQVQASTRARVTSLTIRPSHASSGENFPVPRGVHAVSAGKGVRSRSQGGRAQARDPTT